MFDPEKDLASVQNVFLNDTEILDLMSLNTETPLEKAKHIIKRSQYGDLSGGEKRLCIFFVPSRLTRNEAFLEEVIQVDCHVPISQDYIAHRIQKRVKELLHKKKFNNRYLKYEGQLGELPTANGFFCVGSRFKFYRVI